MTLDTLPKTDDAALLRNPYAVRRWLETKDPGAVVGMTGDASACTLHTFIAETTGQAVHVMPLDYRIGAYGWYAMPAWAMRFVLHHDSGTSPVTAAQALHALALALEE